MMVGGAVPKKAKAYHPFLPSLLGVLIQGILDPMYLPSSHLFSPHVLNLNLSLLINPMPKP